MKQKVKSLKGQEKFSNRKERQNIKKQAKGITLIALVITIIVLLILARSKYSNANRRQWIIKQGK